MYQSKKINDESYVAIQSLYKAAFNQEKSLEFVATKYNTSMFGLKNIGILAESESGEFAAYYGVFPVVLRYKGSDHLIAQSGDTMTSPNHQKKGLFVRLAQETYELCKTQGIKMVYGFPNENSFPGFQKKLNWVFNDFMQKFTFTVGTIPFCELASKVAAIQPLYDSYAKMRVKKYTIPTSDKIIKQFSDESAKGEIKKDSNFFDYKLNSKNVYLVHYGGFTMLIKVGPHLHIGAVEKIQSSQTNDLLRAIKKLAIKLGCKKIIFLVSKNHWLHDCLITYHKAEDSLPIGFFVIDKSIDYKSIQFTLADYDTF